MKPIKPYTIKVGLGIEEVLGKDLFHLLSLREVEVYKDKGQDKVFSRLVSMISEQRVLLSMHFAEINKIVQVVVSRTHPSNTPEVLKAKFLIVYNLLYNPEEPVDKLLSAHGINLPRNKITSIKCSLRRTLKNLDVGELKDYIELCYKIKRSANRTKFEV